MILAKRHQIFFPHDEENKDVKSKDIIAKSDYLLAEVSQPSTGQGIELGWADTFNTPIICFYRAGSEPSNSLRFVSNSFIEYSSSEDMVKQLSDYLEL